MRHKLLDMAYRLKRVISPQTSRRLLLSAKRVIIGLVIVERSVG